MNLAKLFKWNKTEEQDLKESNGITENQTSSNVVALPLPVDQVDQKESTLDLPQPSKLNPIKGLMSAPELKVFFDENYFGLGVHNGSNYQTQEALELGKRSLISKFQNTLSELVENKQAKISKLQNQMVAIDGISPSMTQQLKLACEHLEREIKLLAEQIELANQQKGWVLEAINRYQLGYIKGLNDAIEFENLIAG